MRGANRLRWYSLLSLRVTVLVCALPLQARAKDGRRPKLEITIWVYNYAQVSAHTLNQGKTEVARLFHGVGVNINWLECPISLEQVQRNSVCQQRMLPSELALEILPTFSAPTGPGVDNRLGYSQTFSDGQHGHYAYLSYEQVENLVSGQDWSVSEILACVAAHEIGHLLLRSNAHSPNGIMRAQWNRRDLEDSAQGQLQFTPEQAQVIRAEVDARMRQQQAIEFSEISSSN